MVILRSTQNLKKSSTEIWLSTMGPRIMRFLGIVRCDFKTTLTPLCHPYQIAETSILDSRKEILTKMQLPRAIITSKLEKCLKITHLPTSSKKSDKKGKIAIRIFFSFPTKFPIATLSIIWKLHLAVYRFSRIPVEQIQTH